MDSACWTGHVCVRSVNYEYENKCEPFFFFKEADVWCKRLQNVVVHEYVVFTCFSTVKGLHRL